MKCSNCSFSSSDAWEPSGHYNSSSQISLTQKYTDARTGKQIPQRRKDAVLHQWIFLSLLYWNRANKIQLKLPQKLPKRTQMWMTEMNVQYCMLWAVFGVIVIAYKAMMCFSKPSIWPQEWPEIKQRRSRPHRMKRSPCWLCSHRHTILQHNPAEML